MTRIVFLLSLLAQSSALLPHTSRSPRPDLRSFVESDASGDALVEDSETNEIEKFLSKKFPTFSDLFLDDDMKKAILGNKATIFAPSESAIEALGEKKMAQLQDPRNDETRRKMGLYHVIAGESISATELKTEDWTKGRPKDGSKPNTVIAAVVTMGGEIPVGRSKSGGFLGFGAKEDGDIVVGPSAKIVGSFAVKNSIVHEVDGLVSPEVLWRYCDQLRIPGF
ncbi:unnamed protein product [Cylindrotheca closterium]|uniref:FAS1 domain-containing protein n=1 Tax=Cylindrotheca closterium TaxID=2856 RepID=A0AAD2G9Z8_9STRA|nr:unnamed protein product [Cylindrotheca closterium]